MDDFRIALFEQVLTKGWSQFSSIDSLCIASDGTYISLTLGGKLQNRGHTPQILKELYQLPAHIVTINYNETDQIDFCMPIRMNQSAPLKGFIIINNVDEKVSEEAG